MIEQNDVQLSPVKPEIRSENDIPFESSAPCGDDPGISEPEKVSYANVNALEKLAGIRRSLHSLALKNGAFRIIVACLISIGILYGMDVFLINMAMPNSQMLDSIFEFLKYIITTLIGFLFASKVNGKED